ncbi:unnamed protein product, partial [Symbiodinium natans]
MQNAQEKIEESLQGIEHAMAAVATAASAGEMRQDRAAGLQSDVSRHAGQALQQYSAEVSAAIWLQRRLQACLESSCKITVQLRADGAVYWRLQLLEVKLVLCRDLLLQPEEAALLNAVSNIRGLQTPGGPLQIAAQLWRSTTHAEFVQMQQTAAVQAHGMQAIVVQITDRFAEVQSLLQTPAANAEETAARTLVNAVLYWLKKEGFDVEHMYGAMEPATQ